VINSLEDEKVIENVKEEVNTMMGQFPLFAY